MDKLVLASGNAGKLKELSSLLAPLGIEVLPQSAFNVSEAEEPHPSFVENAIAKARHAARATGLPVMVFAGNGSIIQIHTGPVQQVQYDHGWLHVLDPAFTLHLDGTQIDQAWITHKPGDNGVVTSLELFDRDGQSVVTFFGARKPGQPEQPAWQALMDSLPKEVCHG